MKFGPLDGTTEEINRFFEDRGLDATQYFEPAHARIRAVCLVVAIALLLVVAFALGLFGDYRDGRLGFFVFLLGFADVVWLTVVIELRYGKHWASGMAFLGSLLLLMLALRLVTPWEVIGLFKRAKA